MSTLTKIKGVITNYGLPVVTSEGLLPYWQGRFINRLAEQGYELSSSQKEAIHAFLISVAEEDCVNDIRSLWPFIGNRENTKAAKVPLIGEKLFDFNDTYFNDIEYNTSGEIVGITSTPDVPTLIAMDFCDEHCVNIGTSLIKPVTAAPSQEFMVRSIVTQNNGVQYRPVQANSTVVGGNPVFSVYCRSDVHPNGGNHYISSVSENINDAGNLYTIFGFNDKSVTPYYNRMCNMNGVERYAAGIEYTPSYLPPTEETARGTVTSGSYGINCTVTGLVVFNKILTKDKIKIFTDAWKQMNIALGKEVVV